jgi:hypothetical protein
MECWKDGILVVKVEKNTLKPFLFIKIHHSSIPMFQLGGSP